MTKKITLNIHGMECANCSMILERIEDELDGVFFAEASYRKARLVVEYDESRISLERIKEKVHSLGYGVIDG